MSGGVRVYGLPAAARLRDSRSPSSSTDANANSRYLSRARCTRGSSTVNCRVAASSTWWTEACPSGVPSCDAIRQQQSASYVHVFELFRQVRDCSPHPVRSRNAWYSSFRRMPSERCMVTTLMFRPSSTSSTRGFRDFSSFRLQGMRQLPCVTSVAARYEANRTSNGRHLQASACQGMH